MKQLQAPFPWFGGKRKVASEVWARFGRVDNYVEPFFGSGATMPPDWRVWRWNAGQGFGAQATDRSENGRRERIWFSSACIDVGQLGLFGGAA